MQNGAHALATVPPLAPAELFDGARLVVLGGTGFLGKVFWIMLLDRFPMVGKIFLLTRSGKGKTSEQRFWSDVATSEAIAPLREAHGDGFEEFLRSKIVPIDGDMGRPCCGIDGELVKELKGTIDAVVNVAGIVDFNPPLDESLEANAFGAQNLIALAKALGDVPVMHTSTCYVAGKRKGPIFETDPREFPFPRADELGRDLWDPDREIAECLDLIAQAKHRCDDAFRQSEFLEKAEQNLRKRGEPAYGESLDGEIAKVKRKFISERLIEAGLDRATHWGWPNIYTYTKSIGEQIIARSGLPFTIARPACCETTQAFPFEGWNEGISTSVPIIFLTMKGTTHVPAKDVPLDFIPTDYVCAGMILTLAELLEGSQKAVYQYGASDVNPCTAARLGELVGLYKRKHYQRKSTGNPFLNFIQAHLEPTLVGSDALNAFGPPGIAKATKSIAALMKKAAIGPMAPILKPGAKSLEAVSAQQQKVGEILNLFAPFTTVQNGPFSCANTRAAYGRLSSADKAKLDWTPEKLDWAEWMQEIHLPGVEKWILPEMEKKLKKELKPLRAHETLVTLLGEMAERHDLALSLQRLEDDGLSRVTFRDVKRRADALAARLAALGVGKGDRVLLSAHNHPAWAIAFFGIVRAGATAVPCDAAMAADELATVAKESAAKVALVDAQVEERAGAMLRDLLRVVDVHAATEEDASLAPPAVAVEEADVASLLYTSGTTGTPKGVMLTHANFTSLIAALAPIFPLGAGDRVLSVLPLHHTFEFTCGLLLPFSRGARVVYVGEISGERIARGLELGRATAMVGVPALWHLLERRILAQVDARGPIAKAAFNLGGEMNRMLGKTLGIDAGRVLFGDVHDALGGSVKYLISGGAALPKETHQLFKGLGLHLTEGYGLTEAAPVLTVASPSPKSRAGTVGKPIPGVDVRIDNPDASGVGEVLAKGPNVMAGYTDADATAQVIDKDGWLHTGDLGRFDKRGQLEIVGRLKDVIITANGENVYPDDLEKRLGKVAFIEELAVVGVPGGREGSERIACLAVPSADDDVLRAERMDRAQKALRDAINELPLGMRPSVVKVYDAPLPRTATRKVKRNEVKEILARMMAATSIPPGAEADATPVRVAIAAVRGRQLREVVPSATLLGDLGFDSLSMQELLVALEAKAGTLDPHALLACQTVADVEAIVGAAHTHAHAAESRTKKIEKGDDDDATPVLPPQVQEIGKRVIGKLQDAFYGNVMLSKVTGRAFIPQNRNTIVVANHASHLDMGFVRHALGKYGEDIVSLAAQDYFFDGSPLRRAFFENFSNLKAIDRRASLRQAERQAAEVIEEGKTMLIFPEGTRSSDGDVHEFKPLVGQLALHHDVDILPVYIGGTRQAMPKGATVPTRRAIFARIGPPLCVADLKRLTAGMSRADAAREVARLAREAVVALRDGGVLDLAAAKKDVPLLASKPHPLVELFGELEQKFRPGSATKPISWYFTLGGEAMAKWTVKVDPTSCEIKAGKPESGTADCVLKTSAEIFTKIVRESYTPGPAEFLSGAIKSNDVELLQTFQKVFQLG